MLQYLRAVSDSIVAEGHERVDGLETTHYHAELNLDRVAAALPSADQAAAEKLLSAVQQAMPVSAIPVDIAGPLSGGGIDLDAQPAQPDLAPARVIDAVACHAGPVRQIAHPLLAGAQ
jgi:hypothetical protein